MVVSNCIPPVGDTLSARSSAHEFLSNGAWSFDSAPCCAAVSAGGGVGGVPLEAEFSGTGEVLNDTTAARDCLFADLRFTGKVGIADC